MPSPCPALTGLEDAYSRALTQQRMLPGHWYQLVHWDCPCPGLPELILSCLKPLAAEMVLAFGPPQPSSPSWLPSLPVPVLEAALPTKAGSCKSPETADSGIWEHFPCLGTFFLSTSPQLCGDMAGCRLWPIYSLETLVHLSGVGVWDMCEDPILIPSLTPGPARSRSPCCGAQMPFPPSCFARHS